MVNTDNDRPQFSFAIVADTHLTRSESLSFDGSESAGNKLAVMYDDLVARVNAMNPEFVVHLGDITDPVPVSPEFGDSAQAFHKASEVFSMPYYLLPQQLRDLTSQETTGGRVLSAECDDGMALLISPNSCAASSEFSDHFPDGIADRQGTLVDLVSGTEMTTALREVIAKRAGEETPQSPALLLVND
jgi:3',5'-cyclic AMP phosphodiesterase CpdA